MLLIKKVCEKIIEVQTITGYNEDSFKGNAFSVVGLYGKTFTIRLILLTNSSHSCFFIVKSLRDY